MNNPFVDFHHLQFKIQQLDNLAIWIPFDFLTIGITELEASVVNSSIFMVVSNRSTIVFNPATSITVEEPRVYLLCFTSKSTITFL